MTEERLLSARTIAAMCEVDISTIYKWMRAGDFPPPLKVGGKANSRWRYSDVKEWMDGLKPDATRPG